MKLLFMIGDSAVGKMTVGRELEKITGLRLFHNHMMIEPVIEIFGAYRGDTVKRLREVIFEDFAASDCIGMIFTYMWAFDERSDWDYIEHVKSIFAVRGAEFYYVELIAPQEIRLERNRSEYRQSQKASKRDLEAYDRRLINDDKKYRCVSFEGEIPFENYLRLDNSDLPPEKAAELIKARFDL